MLSKEDFVKKVHVAPNECWLWIGAKTTRGYGYVSHYCEGKRKQLAAHRISYALHKGPVLDKNVLHKCDNPLCVNPDHLFLGTQEDNMKDMATKGRGRTGLLTEYRLSGRDYKQYKSDWARAKRRMSK